LFDPVGSNN